MKRTSSDSAASPSVRPPASVLVAASLPLLRMICLQHPSLGPGAHSCVLPQGQHSTEPCTFFCAISFPLSSLWDHSSISIQTCSHSSHYTTQRQNKTLSRSDIISPLTSSLPVEAYFSAFLYSKTWRSAPCFLASVPSLPLSWIGSYPALASAVLLKVTNS